MTVRNQDLLAGFDREEPKQFTGHERDFLSYGDYSLAPDYMHMRSYSSASLRFLSVDPSAVAANPDEPQNWNCYRYAAANPTKMIDPDGKEAIVFIAGASNIFKDASGAFGHTAIWVGSGSRSNGLSFGSPHGFKRDQGSADFLRAYQKEGRQVHVFVLKTSPDQDAKMLQFIEQRPSPFVGFSICTNNCTTTVTSILQAGGVVPTTQSVVWRGGVAVVTVTYYTPESLESALNGGSSPELSRRSGSCNLSSAPALGSLIRLLGRERSSMVYGRRFRRPQSTEQSNAKESLHNRSSARAHNVQSLRTVSADSDDSQYAGNCESD